MRAVALLAVLACGLANAQEPVTAHAARSYVKSAFITGAAPAILSATVRIAPALRARLGLPQNADRDAVYRALIALTAGKPIEVSESGPGELAGLDRAPLTVAAGDDVRLAVQYDLRANNIAFVGLVPAEGETPGPPIP
jgi:hypothetical protein